MCKVILSDCYITRTYHILVFNVSQVIIPGEGVKTAWSSYSLSSMCDVCFDTRKNAERQALSVPNVWQ